MWTGLLKRSLKCHAAIKACTFLCWALLQQFAPIRPHEHQSGRALAWDQTRDSNHSTGWTWFSWSGIALWSGDISGWKGDYRMVAGVGEPRTGPSCLSRNIWHLNWQIHVTGPKTVMWLFAVSLIWLLKVAATHLFEPMLLHGSSCRGGDSICPGL